MSKYQIFSIVVSTSLLWEVPIVPLVVKYTIKSCEIAVVSMSGWLEVLLGKWVKSLILGLKSYQVRITYM